MIKKLTIIILIILAAANAFAYQESKTASVTSIAATYTEAIEPQGSESASTGYGALFLSGTWVGTVLVQASVDGATWHTVGSYTANGVYLINLPVRGVFVRAGCAANGWTSGTITIQLVR